jgi:hypothetical protein
LKRLPRGSRDAGMKPHGMWRKKYNKKCRSTELIRELSACLVECTTYLSGFVMNMKPKPDYGKSLRCVTFYFSVSTV